jgi:carbamoyltransferase
MQMLLGISGSKRNACAAACVNGHIRAVCEQERLTRVRAVGLESGSLPGAAVDEVLALSGYGRSDVATYVVAERSVELPSVLPTIALNHHQAHAATAFLTSSLPRAAVLVCDGDSARELSVWTGEGGRLRDERWPWQGRAFATLYSDCTELFGFARNGQEHHLEGLARIGQGNRVEQLRTSLQYADGSLKLRSGWQADIDQLIQCCGPARRGDAASAVQRRIGELLLELVQDIRRTLEEDALCLGGGLFYNTYFTTLIRKSGIFRKVFVPINPGNAGLAVGATLLTSPHGDSAPSGVSPFLGPEYDSEAIKATLDGCKLSYAFVGEGEALDQAVDALTHGQLVGWFQGRMEWGHRALGHRSILADPRSPYVLDNLNSFLRKRERWRSFGFSVCDDSFSRFFCGPPSSPFMEFEYDVRPDCDAIRHAVPKGATALRVQTIAPERGLFWALHKRMEQATGTGVLVNTSFNGFHEPIACSPHDAIRVFYGTGLDMLVMGRFIIKK